MRGTVPEKRVFGEEKEMVPEAEETAKIKRGPGLCVGFLFLFAGTWGSPRERSCLCCQLGLAALQWGEGTSKAQSPGSLVSGRT